MGYLDSRFFDRDGCLDHAKAARAGRAAQARHISAGLRACRNFVLGTIPSGRNKRRRRSRSSGLSLADLMTQSRPQRA